MPDAGTPENIEAMPTAHMIPPRIQFVQSTYAVRKPK